MRNPWQDLPQQAPFVLPLDKDKIAYHNRLRGAVDSSSAIHLELLPEPFLGRRNAPIVLLNLNPGYSPLDEHYHHHDAYFIESNRKNLVHAKLDYPFYLLDKKNRASPGYRWWKPRLRRLIADCGEDGQRRVAHGVLCVELFGYHSAQCSFPIPNVPSQQYAFHLVHRAMKRDTLIIVMRRRWLNVMPELTGYLRLYDLNAKRCMYFTPKNCPEGYREAVDILRGMHLRSRPSMTDIAT